MYLDGRLLLQNLSESRLEAFENMVLKKLARAAGRCEQSTPYVALATVSQPEQRRMKKIGPFVIDTLGTNDQEFSFM